MVIKKVKRLSKKTSTVWNTLTFWNKNGQIESKIFINKDGETFREVFWYENGQKKEDSYYKGLRDLDGKSTVWYENGQKRLEENNKDGELDGKSTEWYENGQKSEEGSYKDDKKDGKWTSWHKDGQLEFELHYKDGEPVSEQPLPNTSTTENIDDAEFYLIATKEVESGQIDKALWAKCMAVNMGDEHKSKYDYINKRVSILAKEV